MEARSKSGLILTGAAAAQALQEGSAVPETEYQMRALNPELATSMTLEEALDAAGVDRSKPGTHAYTATFDKDSGVMVKGSRPAPRATS